MSLSTTCSNRFQKFIFIAFQLYNITIGTLLTAFVPQKCNNNSCTILDIIRRRDDIDFIALIFNIFTFNVFLLAYLVEYRREKWCQKYLENLPAIETKDIPAILSSYPEIEQTIYSWNFYYICWIRLAYFVYLLNIILSAFSISNNYLDSTTATSFIGFIFLTIYKLNDSFNISYFSYNENIAYSAYQKYHMSYNALKPQFHKYDFYTSII